MPKRRSVATLPAEPAGRVERTGRLLSDARELSLHQRLVDGDEQALVELIDVTAPWLMGIAQRMLQDRTEAEEVLQEVYTIAWRRIAQVEPSHGFLAWLLRVTRNRTIDRLRARKRRTLRLVPLEEGQREGGRPPVEPDESALPGWHVHESVHGALTRLPAEQREAVELAYFEGLTQSQVAEQLGIPLGTVKTRLRLAFDRLRVALAPIKDWVS
jgi:RNA polymerase sigma-70 factor, ECF subfamily